MSMSIKGFEDFREAADQIFDTLKDSPDYKELLPKLDELAQECGGTIYGQMFALLSKRSEDGQSLTVTLGDDLYVVPLSD